ncbi:D-alanyl-D-alanine carboxypeptidase family protein [Pseudomonas germanica]|jgi:hypothetical protein
MKTPLVLIDVPSIYENKHGIAVSLPRRLASASPDMALAITRVGHELEKLGGRLVLSDLYRSYDMQMQAHLDYVKKNKSAFSPAPGGSFHESGRAMDISLSDLKVSLQKFWEIAAVYGLNPIIDEPKTKISESWHFECRGSHQVVIDYYKAGNGSNFEKPYTAGAASAILASGGKVDKFGENQREAQLQAALIRCGYVIGDIDGVIGVKTRTILSGLSIDDNDIDQALKSVEDLVQTKFPEEYRISNEIALLSLN